MCAHSTVRSLLSAYRGNLYQVQRASDKATKDIGLLKGAQQANSTEQDMFCRDTTCTVTMIFDQSGHGNDLTVGTPGGANPRGNTAASATAESIQVQGKKVYSLYMNPGEGYFHDGSRSGIPTGTDPGGIYMVTSGTHFNDGCCFDYGNGEANRRDNGDTHMNAIYFGNACSGCAGHGKGPWVQADLENGLFSGGSRDWNPQQRAMPERFVTAMEKNDGMKRFALKGGNAQSGDMMTMYDGPLPGGYSPMRVEGGIILGTGGDDSSWSEGTFYEGAMVKGFPTDETEAAVQANVVSAGYAV